MYAVKKVELQRLVVLAKSPVNSPGKVFTTADGENNWKNTNTNTGNDTNLNPKSQMKAQIFGLESSYMSRESIHISQCLLSMGKLPRIMRIQKYLCIEMKIQIQTNSLNCLILLKVSKPQKS